MTVKINGKKWDWDKKQLIAGEKPSKYDLPDICIPFLLPAIGLIMYWFINYAAPWLGHLLLGGFL